MIFLEPDYMIRNGPVCQAKLFCKVATSTLSHVILDIFTIFAALTKVQSSRSQSGKPRQPV